MNSSVQTEADVFWEKDELVFTTGITDENEECLTDAQGITHFISTKKCLFKDSAGNTFLVGTIRDITQSITASQQRLALLIQQTPVGVIEWSTKFAVKAWNPAAEKIFGYSTNEALGSYFDFIVPRKNKAQLGQVLATLLSQKGGSWSINENLTKNNKIIICEWYNSPLVDENGELIGVASLVFDITERQQTQKNLMLYKQAVESSSDAIAIADADGHHIYQNQAFCQLYECKTIEEFIQFGGVSHAITDPVVAQEIWQTTVAGESWIGEVEQQSAGGRIMQTFLRSYPLKDAAGNNIGLVGAITDISARKLSEELLRQQEQFLRTVYEGSEHLIFVVDVLDDHEFCYTGWNPATERASGLSKTKVIGKSPIDVHGAVQGEAIYQNYLRCLQTGTPITYEECLTLQDQETWWLTTLNPLKDSEGRVYRLVGTTFNTTDVYEELRLRKRAEIQLQQQTKELETALQELQQTQMQLIQSEKMSGSWSISRRGSTRN